MRLSDFGRCLLNFDSNVFFSYGELREKGGKEVMGWLNGMSFVMSSHD